MKNRVVIGTCAVLVMLAMANLFPGHAQQPRGPKGSDSAMLNKPTLPPILDQGAHLNPLKIALLHWYLADAATFFTVGSQPDGVAFDGANIWTANYGDG